MNVRLEKLKTIPFSSTTIGCSGNFYKILGIAINYILCEKTRPCFGHCYYAFLNIHTYIHNFIPLSERVKLWQFFFLNKKLVKTDDEISNERQKTGFSGIFPAFSAGKVCWLKIGLCQILGIGILHQCAKFHEKI